MAPPAMGPTVVARSFLEIPVQAALVLSHKVRPTASTWVGDSLPLTTTPPPKMRISLLTERRTSAVSVARWSLATSPRRRTPHSCLTPGRRLLTIQERWVLAETPPQAMEFSLSMGQPPLELGPKSLLEMLLPQATVFSPSWAAKPRVLGAKSFSAVSPLPG